MTFTHSADCHDPVCPELHDPTCSVCGVPLHEHLDNNPCMLVDEPRPAIDAEVLGRAIREHRQAEFDPHAVISMTHLCFDDCAENIAARYDELASR